MNKAVALGILFLLTTCTNPTPESIQQNLIPAVIIGNQTPTYPIQQRMAKYNTPGVSIAIFNNNQITWTDTIGVSDANQQTPLATITKFQAASISKPITALGVLKLTQTHNLDLDTDINQCSGQLIPDSDLSFSSLATGGNPSFAACGRF